MAVDKEQKERVMKEHRARSKSLWNYGSQQRTEGKIFEGTKK